MQAELKRLNEIRYWLSQVLGPEQVEALAKAKGKQSVVKQLYGNKEETLNQDESNSKKKEQNMER